MKTMRFSFKKEIDTIAMFAIMLVLFFIIMFDERICSDLLLHAIGAQLGLEEGRLFDSNFLMYFMANLLSGFSGNIIGIRIGIVFLIAVSETAKYYLTKTIFAEFSNEKVSKICSCALMFVYVIPIFYFLKVFGLFENTNNMYLGYCVPNVWHNSTILCCMPFAIGIYWLSVKQFNEYSANRNKILSLLVVLCVLVKPSFFFVYVVSYPLLMLISYRLSKTFICSMLPILFGVLTVVYEYVSIYGNPSDGSSVVIDFSVLFNIDFWKSKIKYLCVSLAYIVIFVVLYWKRIRVDKEFWFVVVMIVVSIGISYVCKESGPRATHGNFGWQIIPAMWFAYYYILKTLIVDYMSKDTSESIGLSSSATNAIHLDKTTLMLLLFVIHTIIGVYYLLRFVIIGSYF